MVLGLLAPLTLAALALLTPLSALASDPPLRPLVKIVDVRGAAALLARGATVLDARPASAFAGGHLPGAQPYSPRAVLGEGPTQKPDLAGVARALSLLGVQTGRPALVYGNASTGGGEDGQAAWLLALLGLSEVAMLDGGFAAWRAAGRPVVTSLARPSLGRLEPAPRWELLAGQRQWPPEAQLLDVRSLPEFRGAVGPGRLPGAHNLDWREVLDESGRVRTSAQLGRSLQGAGIDPQRPIVTYCSDGARCAFVSAVLLARGAPAVLTYLGSVEDWARDGGNVLERG